MPFAKNEIVPDVIPVAPKEVAKVNYVSGGMSRKFPLSYSIDLTFSKSQSALRWAMS